ncbi:MAG: hypothetical protein ACJAUD_000690 [Crocinitomicaceae bacterium]|jgi:hypothetical protein
MKNSLNSLLLSFVVLLANSAVKTVKEDDLEGNKTGCHEDAIIIFTSEKDITSMSISKPLSRSKQDSCKL